MNDKVLPDTGSPTPLDSLPFIPEKNRIQQVSKLQWSSVLANLRGKTMLDGNALIEFPTITAFLT